jgi:hypothetical protein
VISQSRIHSILLILILLVMPIGFFAFVYFIGPETAKPNEHQMRAHRLNLLSDADVAAIRRVAMQRVALAERNFEESEKARAAQREKTAQQCSDEIYKIRHQFECERRISFGPDPIAAPFSLDDAMVPIPSLEREITKGILGACAYVGTIREAQRVGCLPK